MYKSVPLANIFFDHNPWHRVSEFVNKTSADGGINAGFFRRGRNHPDDSKVLGMVIIDGERGEGGWWDPSAFWHGILKAKNEPPKIMVSPESYYNFYHISDIEWAISMGPIVLQDAHVEVLSGTLFPGVNPTARTQRVGFGIANDTAIFAYLESATAKEMGQYLKDVGAVDGILADGGSSASYIEGSKHRGTQLVPNAILWCDDDTGNGNNNGPDNFDIIQDFIPIGRKNRPGLFMMPQWVTIHDTGNRNPGAGAIAHGNYLKTDAAANAPVSWHFTVDDSVVVQHLPLDEVGWHAGDGYGGKGNRESIGIEIAMNQDGDRAQAEENAAKLCSYLLDTVDSLLPFPESLTQHFDWSKKNCPQYLRSGVVNTWEEFLQMIDSDKTKVDWRLEGIDYFDRLAMLNSPEEWADKALADEPMPVWASFIMLKRIHKDVLNRLGAD